MNGGRVISTRAEATAFSANRFSEQSRHSDGEDESDHRQPTESQSPAHRPQFPGYQQSHRRTRTLAG
jgi:hypothetical protein